MKQLGAYFVHLAHHYHGVHCRTIAASLSFTSLLALVPLMAIIFSVLAEVPYFEKFRHEFLAFVLGYLIPEFGKTFANYFDELRTNTGKITGFGVTGLVITAVMLINTIFMAMNLIFRVEKPRPVLLRIVVYLGVLIIGPIVLASSFSLATYILTLTKAMGVDAFTGLLGRLTRFVPALLLIVGFSVFYKVVPNCRVAWGDAIGGGLVAGLVFSGLRWLFGIYLIYFPVSQNIYGALSVMPIFLLWLFTSWSVVLTGAVVTASGPNWRSKEG